MMAPTSVCELEAGSPMYQVPKFHRMAESSSENIMAKPAPEPTFNTSSTGNKATVPDEVRTPARLQSPDHTTATTGFSVWV